MHLSLLLHPGNEKAVQTVGELFTVAGKMDIPIHLSRRIMNQLPDSSSPPDLLELHDSDVEAIEKSQITVAIGGDGTMLRAAKIVRSLSRPLLGINSGKLGFLADIKHQNLESAITEVLAGRYELETRYFLEADFSDGQVHYALNEFVFSGKGSVSMITLTAEYDGDLINRYWADGIIVSSPTGSTAYNLSTGGPIVLPQTDVMVLTPINPHTLTTRPLVLPSKKKLTIKVEPAEQHVLFSGDGKHHELPSRSPVVDIRQSEHHIQLIKLPGQSYFETLRNKLMWGVDMRENI